MNEPEIKEKEYPPMIEKLAEVKKIHPEYMQIIGQQIKLNGIVIKGSKKVYKHRLFTVVDIRKSKQTVKVKEADKQKEYQAMEFLLRDGIRQPQWSNPFPMKLEYEDS
jgi:hypothetical protein